MHLCVAKSHSEGVPVALLSVLDVGAGSSPSVEAAVQGTDGPVVDPEVALKQKNEEAGQLLMMVCRYIQLQEQRVEWEQYAKTHPKPADEKAVPEACKAVVDALEAKDLEAVKTARVKADAVVDAALESMKNSQLPADATDDQIVSALNVVRSDGANERIDSSVNWIVRSFAGAYEMADDETKDKLKQTFPEKNPEGQLYFDELLTKSKEALAAEEAQRAAYERFMAAQQAAAAAEQPKEEEEA
ncbi:hypothetical protein GNI_020550 [Gregarina niphandrodes]|uniref:Uncharacterized protein n=1 Tax=Gregarina niphandrodes TaxID=110365 RepID=A0A023BBZ1_GRENI|nr:hypothetical protein GNI_020550 [Gregarina niphandrodes]EZG80925.1 hypothetical protein GNI_020550 [Gregarina niphandrodes]|eukprot:XP_011134283.1 hypothetical protein GNI_020550 [Gregarina niphandrodes]